MASVQWSAEDGSLGVHLDVIHGPPQAVCIQCLEGFGDDSEGGSLGGFWVPGPGEGVGLPHAPQQYIPL